MTQAPVGYEALRTGTASRVVTGAGQFEAVGPDAAACLNRVVPADLSRLVPGLGTRTLLLRDDGAIVARLTLYRFSDRVLVVTDPAQRDVVWQELVARKRGQVRLRDISDDTACLQVRGPATLAVLASRLVPVPAEAGVIVMARYGSTELFAARALPGEPDGIDLYCRARDLTALHATLAEAGVPVAESAAWELLRIESGLAAVGAEIRDDDTPVEAGLEDLVPEGKGAPFPGEFAVAARRRQGPRKRLVGIRIAGDRLPPVGAEVTVAGLAVGPLRSVAWSPGFGAIGMIAVPTSATAAGTDIQLHADGGTWSAAIARVPFGTGD